MWARQIVDYKKSYDVPPVFTQDEWQRALAELSQVRLSNPHAAAETLTSVVSSDEISHFMHAYRNVSMGRNSNLSRDFHEGTMLGLVKASAEWEDKESVSVAQKMFVDLSEVWFGVRPEQAAHAFRMFRAAHSSENSDSLSVSPDPSIVKARNEGRLHLTEKGEVSWATSSGVTTYNIKGNPTSAILYTQRPEPVKRPIEDFNVPWTGPNQPSVHLPKGFPGMAA